METKSETEIETIHRSIASQIRLTANGPDAYSVHTPFAFDDGDCYELYLSKIDGRWFVCDQGSTLFHLGVMHTELDERKYRKKFQSGLSQIERFWGIDCNEGECAWLLPVEGDDFGDAVFKFMSAIRDVASLANRLTG